jgi:hypothetical protein
MRPWKNSLVWIPFGTVRHHCPVINLGKEKRKCTGKEKLSFLQGKISSKNHFFPLPNSPPPSVSPSLKREGAKGGEFLCMAPGQPALEIVGLSVILIQKVINPLLRNWIVLAELISTHPA